jgi:hypothetical protein
MPLLSKCWLVGEGESLKDIAFSGLREAQQYFGPDCHRTIYYTLLDVVRLFHRFRTNDCVDPGDKFLTLVGSVLGDEESLLFHDLKKGRVESMIADSRIKGLDMSALLGSELASFSRLPDGFKQAYGCTWIERCPQSYCPFWKETREGDEVSTHFCSCSGSVSYECENRRTGDVFRFSSLNLLMIRRHHFYAPSSPRGISHLINIHQYTYLMYKRMTLVGGYGGPFSLHISDVYGGPLRRR